MEKLTALNVFRAVCELGSFSGAARKLRLSNAAVSKNVRELEYELGARLLERTTRRVRMTEVGEAYWRRASAILDELRVLDTETKDHGRVPRGTLRVAAPMSLGIAQLAPAVGAFLVEYPELHVELEMNDRYVDLVGEGFDVALRGGTLADSSLVARRLGAIQRVLCASPAYLRKYGRPARPQDLPQHRCLVYSLAKSPTRWTLTRKTRRIRLEIQGPLINSSLALAGAASAGAGIALLPEVTVRDALAKKQLETVLPDWTAEPQSLFAVYPRHHQISHRVRLFIDFLAARFTVTMAYK
jgi:DNA-binding transcriptional LysR family regulator